MARATRSDGRSSCRPRGAGKNDAALPVGTGGVGSQVVDRLRANGHAVTAYVRTATTVPGSWADNVTVVVGELSDAVAVDRAVQDAAAVVSARTGRPACPPSWRRPSYALIGAVLAINN